MEAIGTCKQNNKVFSKTRELFSTSNCAPSIQRDQESNVEEWFRHSLLTCYVHPMYVPQVGTICISKTSKFFTPRCKIWQYLRSLIHYRGRKNGHRVSLGLGEILGIFLGKRGDFHYRGRGCEND